MGLQHCRLLIHSDNQGTIGVFEKGCSPNSHINLLVHRTYLVLSNLSISPEIVYIESITNPADPILCGDPGQLESSSSQPSSSQMSLLTALFMFSLNRKLTSLTSVTERPVGEKPSHNSISLRPTCPQNSFHPFQCPLPASVTTPPSSDHLSSKLLSKTNLTSRAAHRPRHRWVDGRV